MKQLQDDHHLHVGDVAAMLGVSTSRIRQLDDELQPRRHTNGTRRYSASRVAELLAKRER